MATDKNGIYYNEFFEGKDPDSDFTEHPLLANLTQRQVIDEKAKFYFLPFLINCYLFTRQHQLPKFAIPVSPTMMFYRDRLHNRGFLDSVFEIFFECMEMCGVLHEPIMLMVEKRFHIFKPIDGGTQQLYNMLWDVDLDPKINRCYLPSKMEARLPSRVKDDDENNGWSDANQNIVESDLWLSRRTLWFIDDLKHLGKRFILDGECHYTEILDFTNVDESRAKKMKPREFYFKTFLPKKVEEEEEEAESTESDIELDMDEFDSTDSEMVADPNLDFDAEDDEMKKILAFFANMPKVTGLVQGMLDMITSLTRILPIVANKLEKPEDANLKSVIERLIGILNKGTDKILKLCVFLGIKVEKKPSGAIAVIVKDRFKKDKKDFIEYEIDELNKVIDALEDVDSDKKLKPIHPGDIPPDMTENNLYPQMMKPHGHIHLADNHSLKPHLAPPCKPPCQPPHKDIDWDKHPPIPSVKPEPPNKPKSGEHGVKG